MGQLRLSKKKQFGASSERMEEGLVEQLSLTFNEVETYQPKDEAPATTVKSYERKGRSGSVADVVPEDAPVKVFKHRLPEEERVCAECGEPMQEIDKEVRRTLFCCGQKVNRTRQRQNPPWARRCTTSQSNSRILQDILKMADWKLATTVQNVASSHFRLRSLSGSSGA